MKMTSLIIYRREFMPSLIELEEIIENALGENEQLSKKDINKMIETDGGHLATALRSLIQKNRIVSGSDGSTRVYRLNS